MRTILSSAVSTLLATALITTLLTMEMIYWPMGMNIYWPLGVYLPASCLHVYLSQNNKEDLNIHLVRTLKIYVPVYVLVALALFFFSDNIPIGTQQGLNFTGLVGITVQVFLMTYVDIRYFVQWLCHKTRDENSNAGEQSKEKIPELL
ncbi:hypothetical protein BGZ83_001199 [Gryganskiella cystojenkinii]|nr:hypothetical protein BGZ83_001199 [Gryganskiella cystojenkinii]